MTLGSIFHWNNW